MVEILAPGVRVHRIADEPEKPRRKASKAKATSDRPASVPTAAFEQLLTEYRSLVAELATCCMSGERFLLAKAAIERAEATLRPPKPPA